MVFGTYAYNKFEFILKQITFIDYGTGLCSEYGEIRSKIILAGDPKQLDAVTKSDHATKYGFKTSFMESLFKHPLYSNHEGHYNPNFIIQLTKNYRSHRDILCIPNKLFYNDTLEYKANEGL